jgi:stringent starvation protein B
MTSSRPYLVRALIDWIVDNGCTPYIAIDCEVPGVEAPLDDAVDGKLVLNVSAEAIRNLDVGNDALCVDCRFHGRPFHIQAPVGAIVAIYARESGMGMAFEAEAGDEVPTQPPPRTGRPKLTLVK